MMVKIPMVLSTAPTSLALSARLPTVSLRRPPCSLSRSSTARDKVLSKPIPTSMSSLNAYSSHISILALSLCIYILSSILGYIYIEPDKLTPDLRNNQLRRLARHGLRSRASHRARLPQRHRSQHVARRGQISRSERRGSSDGGRRALRSHRSRQRRRIRQPPGHLDGVARLGAERVHGRRHGQERRRGLLL